MRWDSKLLVRRPREELESQNEYLTEITASNDSGSDTINVKVKVLDSLCEFDTAAVFDNCGFE